MLGRSGAPPRAGASGGQGTPTSRCPGPLRSADADETRPRDDSDATHSSDVEGSDEERPADSAHEASSFAAETRGSPCEGDGCFRGDEGDEGSLDKRTACYESHGACSVRRSRRPR